MALVTVCGMQSEALLIGQRPGFVTVIGAGDASSLASKLDLAIASGADRIISIGVCGALSDSLQVGEIVVGVSVCDSSGAIIHSDDAWARRIYRALTDGPKPVTFPVSFGNIVSTIATVATEAQRAALHASTGADCVDMESWVAASAAKAHGLAFLALRVVLDRSDFNLPVAALLPFKPDGSPDLGAILKSIASDPWQIPGLLQLASFSETAMGNLAIALATIGSGLQTYAA